MSKAKFNLIMNNNLLIGVGVVGTVIVVVAAGIYFLTATSAPLSEAKTFIASIVFLQSGIADGENACPCCRNHGF